MSYPCVLADDRLPGPGVIHRPVPGAVDGLGEEARRGRARGVLVAQPDGSAAFLSYAISRRDPVIVVGQSMGLFIYARNLMLIDKARRGSRTTMRPAARSSSRGSSGPISPPRSAG